MLLKKAKEVDSEQELFFKEKTLRLVQMPS